MAEWAVAGLDDGLVIADLEGRFLLFNAAARRMLGTGPVDVAPDDWPSCFGFYLPDQKTPFPATGFPLTRALHGENAPEVEVFVRSEAVPAGLWICASGSPLKDDAGNLRGGVLIFRDITTAKISEMRLRRERDWGTAIIETVGTLVTVLDREGRIVGFNRACEVASGYQFEEVFHRPVWDMLLLPEEIEPVKRAFEQLRSGVFPARFENWWVAKDGSRRLITWSSTSMVGAGGQVEYVIGTGIDVTERRRAEDEVRMTDATLRAVIETTPLAIVTLDLAGVVKTWNPAAEQIFGWTAGETVGQTLPIVPPADEEFFRNSLESLRQGVTLVGLERQRLRKDGTLIDVALWTAPQRDGAGNIIGVVSVIADMTERKRLEDQFRQAQKMEAVGRLAGGVAHDFNNFLTVISGYTQMLLEGVEEDHPMRSYIEEIAHAGESAATLTNQLLAFSRRQIASLQVLDLNELVGGMGTLLHRLVGEDIELVTVLDPELPKVKVDAGQFQQVMMNLAVNARDAMQGGGTITIETGTTVVDSLTPDGVAPGHYVLLSVSDTGSGMTEQTRKRIFEPFFTTKRRGKGTGLGLSTVYGIVKQAGGEVTVESEVGAGTTFRIFLPAVGRATAAGIESSSGVERPRKCTETVLLAEDQGGLRKLVREVLEGAGYTVLQAVDAREALSLLERYGRPVHLLLAETTLPGAAGRELASRVVAARPEVKVVYIAARVEDASPARKPAAGVYVLVKPFTPETLLAKVREALDAASTPA
jgi:PAS domain S-box-containing protein